MKILTLFLVSTSLFGAGSYQDSNPAVVNYVLTRKLDPGIVQTIANTPIGNPADGILVTDVIQPGPRSSVYALMRASFLYTPATTGPIQSIDASLDVRIDVLVGQVFASGWDLWIQQGSKFYFRDFAAPGVGGIFQKIAATDIRAADFVLFDFTAGVTDANSHPDFGQPITFGFGSLNGYNYAGMGTDTVRLYYDNLSITVNSGGPNVSPGGILNSANYAGAPLAAGSLVSVFGTELAPSVIAATAVPLPTTLGPVSVTIGGIPAALHFVSPTQINVQIPWNVTGPTANMVVTTNGIASPPSPVALGIANPGIYSVNGSGTGQALVLINSDFAIAAPTGSIQGFATRPAIGTDANVNNRDILVIYASGIGPVDSTLLNGANSIDKLRNATTPLEVRIGGVVAPLLFSGLSPQFVGVYQINVRMPAVAAGNAVPIQIVQNGVTSTNLATIAVR
jgi:uncharacterized protein (TIGR03437 family)